jgi:hypothetical protein
LSSSETISSGVIGNAIAVPINETAAQMQAAAPF